MLGHYAGPTKIVIAAVNYDECAESNDRPGPVSRLLRCEAVPRFALLSLVFSRPFLAAYTYIEKKIEESLRHSRGRSWSLRA